MNTTVVCTSTRIVREPQTFPPPTCHSVQGVHIPVPPTGMDPVWILALLVVIFGAMIVTLGMILWFWERAR